MPTPDIAASHRRHLGASKVAAVLNVSRFLTGYQLWCHFTGREELPDLGGNFRVALGEPMEEVLRPFVEDRLGRRLYRDRREYRHPTLPIVCHLDFRAERKPGETVRPVVDMKTSLGFAARARFGADGSDEVDADVMVQMQTYLLCTGALMSYVAALVPGPELKIFPIQADPELHRIIEAGVAGFWHHVETGTPPAITTLADAGRCWPTSSASQVEADDETRAAIAQLRHIKKRVAELEGSAAALELHVKAAMGEHEALVDPEGRPICSWKSQQASRLAADRLKAERPDLYETYIKTTYSRVFRLGKEQC